MKQSLRAKVFRMNILLVIVALVLFAVFGIYHFRLELLNLFIGLVILSYDKIMSGFFNLILEVGIVDSH